MSIDIIALLANIVVLMFMSQLQLLLDGERLPLTKWLKVPDFYS